jgi:hypothetical protein
MTRLEVRQNLMILVEDVDFIAVKERDRGMPLARDMCS